MKIPNGKNAIVDIRKLRDYALNREHRVGKHKAKLFAKLLDMNADDAETFADVLLEVVRTEPAEITVGDQYGQRYQIDFILNWRGKAAWVCSAWIVRSDEAFPRLVTCYPLREANLDDE